MPDALADLERVLQSRRSDRPEGSYTATLFGDPERVSRKVMEEAFEVCLELGRSPLDPERVAEEAADLVFHLLVGLVDAGVAWADVTRVLEGRRR